MRSACVGPLKKSGSPNVMCSAPADTCAATSASTTSRLHDTELTVIDRDHGTMAAQVTASPARLGVADNPARPVGALQGRVRREAGQTQPIEAPETEGEGTVAECTVTRTLRSAEPQATSLAIAVRSASNSPPSTSSTPSDRRNPAFNGAYNPYAQILAGGSSRVPA